MKKITPYFSIIFLLLIQIISAESNFSYCPSDCTKAVQTMLTLPDARHLLTQASKDGDIGIISGRHGSGDFNAYWDGVSRRIIVNTYRPRLLGSKLRSIIFELHNALSSHRLKHLYDLARQGSISKNDFVESIERMEHQNALHTSMVLEKGVREGLYPRECLWNIPHNFQEHYMIQQCSGHSAWLASSYDSNYKTGWRTPYQGTIPGFDKMTKEEKISLMLYVSIKSDLDSRNPEIAKKALNKLEIELQSIKKGTRTNFCYGAKIRLLHKVFSGNSLFERIYRKTS